MNADRNNLPNLESHREPLPGEFDREQIGVDRLLSHSARADAQLDIEQGIPSGLSQRIFEMTASALPTPVQGEAQPRLRLVEAEVARDNRWAFTGWRRFALAASVLLVAGLTLWTTWPTQSPTLPIAQGEGNRGATAPEIRTASSIDLTDLNHFDASNPSAIDAYENNFSYLLDASEVRSFNDLNTDLRLFVAQMEM